MENSNQPVQPSLPSAGNTVSPTPAVTPPVAQPVQQPPTQEIIDENPRDGAELDYLTWSAPEFIEHKKNASWFALYALALIVVTLIIYFVTKSIFSVVIVVIVGITIGIVAARPAKIIEFEVNQTGLKVGQRKNSYAEFKSFSIVDEGSMGSIVFNPFKRFVFPTIIYYQLPDEARIVDMLQNYLPNLPPAGDPVDRLMRRIRF